MKQIVFLIGAFVVLLQLHLTTAATDSETGWDEIESRVLSNTDSMEGWVQKLKEVGESVWKDANVEAPAKWAEYLIQYIKLMDGVKTEFSELIGELKKTVSVEWKEVQPNISDVVAEVFFKIRELVEKVVDVASGTRQKIDDNVDEIIDALSKLMETAPAKTKNILREAAQKKLNAEQTAGGQESQDNE